MSRPKLKSIVMAYNADWSLKGGLSYLADTIRGEEPCELCRITYGGVTKKTDWKQCEKQLLTPVEEVYRNQLDPELAAAVDGAFPMVLARTDQGVLPLLRPEALLGLNRDPVKLYQALLDAIAAADILVGEA